MALRREPRSNFLKIRCHNCKNEQIIFDRASTEVRCLVCNELLAEPTGGKAKIHGTVLEVLN